ncbi:orexin/Hypocretin receptor type 1-like isoform X2 [Apostichopus japonicus]
MNGSSNANPFQYYVDYQDEILEQFSHFVKPDSHDVVILVLFGILFLASIFGNSMVCMAVIFQREMRTVTNFYIVNLAVADLLVSLICLPLNAMNGVSMSWFLGQPMCKFLGFFTLVSLCVSIYTLMMISVDRYLAICRPLKFQISATRVVVVVIIIWVASITVASPLIVVNDVERMPGLVHIDYPNWLAACKEKRWQNTVWQTIYYLFMTFINYVLPLTVIGVAYRNVCKTLWSGIPTEEMSHAETQKLTKSSKEKSKTAAQIESRRKVARMLIVVVLIFAVCLLPFQIVNILRVFGYFNKFDPLTEHNKSNTPILITSLLTYLNSAVNPLIYNFMSAKFRNAFRAMICCRARSTPRNPAYNGTIQEHSRASRRTQAVSSGANTECLPMTNFSSKMDT